MIKAVQRGSVDKRMYVQTFVAPNVSRETGGLVNRVYDDFSGIVLTLARGGHFWILFEIHMDDPAFCSRHRGEAEWAPLAHRSPCRAMCHALDSFYTALPVALRVYDYSLRKRAVLVDSNVQQVLNGVDCLALLTD